MRWAIWRARTQVKVCTRMVCSLQWYIGENETAWGVILLAEAELGVGLER